MAYQIVASPAAARQLAELPARVRAGFLASFLLLENDPMHTHARCDVSKMEGQETYRLRVGRYRGIFRIEGRQVVFLRFSHRSTVYR